jgi:multidrug efflux pump subunit AcrA (membrane-fusion protein)
LQFPADLGGNNAPVNDASRRTYDGRMSRAGHLARTAATVGAVLVVAGCSGDGGSGIEVAEVGRATVVEVVEAPATVTARATATVSAPADGTVARLRVREGERVRAGQVLLRVESPQARRALRQAQQADARAAAAGTPGGTPVDLAGARAAGTDARRAFAQARAAAQRIPDAGARRQALAALRVSLAQYDAAQARAEAAARQLSAGLGSLADAVTALSAAQQVQTRAAVDAARRTVASLVVRAPVAGNVSLAPPPASPPDTAGLLDQLPADVAGQAGGLLGGAAGPQVDAVLAEGQPVRSGEPLLTVTDASTLSLTAQVDETDVLLVQPGVAAAAELDAVPDASYAARVVSLDPAPTSSSRGGVAFVVRLSLDRGTLPDGAAAPTPRPGMSAVVDLRVRTARDAVAVPAAAVFRTGRRDAVWVVLNGVARQRVVRLGAQGRSRVQVLEGLEVGDRVVVRGADRVREGDEVA